MQESGTSFDEQAFARIKVESFNREQGALVGYDCPKCLNRGNFAYLSGDGKRVGFRPCSCMQIRSCVAKMQSSGLKNIISDYTFEKFLAVEPWQQRAKEVAQDYAKNPDGWLFLCGQPGAGKSHLCTAAARALLLGGRAVRYMPWKEESGKIKAMTEGKSEAIAVYQNADVLFIDDLFKTGATADGATRPTMADVGLAFEILNHRYLERAPTIISSELLPAELLAVDEALGSRILELSGAHCVTIGRAVNRNYRLRGLVQV